MGEQALPCRSTPRQRVGAVVVAAGESRRMEGIDKVFVTLMHRPLISYSLEVLNDCPHVDSIVLVLSRDNLDPGRRLVEEYGWHKVSDITVGGARRQDSVRSGLRQLIDVDWVLVHDGARPCLTPDLVARGLGEARRTGAATAAVPVKDTVKLATEDLVVTETLPRERLWSVQTPQVFQRSLLAEAHERVPDDVTDDAAMVERIGGTVRLFHGSYDNIKVTTAQDIAIAEAILGGRAATTQADR